MKIDNLLSDEVILVEIGARLTRRRLELQLTQAQLAEQAGVAKRTLERIEAGASAQMSNLLRIFRVLELLPRLNNLLPEETPHPMDLLKHKGKQRQRASGSRRAQQNDKPWTWDEDT